MKSQLGSGVKLPQSGRVYMRVKRSDQARAVAIARQLDALGFTIVASTVTAAIISAAGIAVTGVTDKSILGMLANKEIGLVILTVDEKRSAIVASQPIRLAALKAGAVVYTTIAGADAALEAMRHAGHDEIHSLQDLHQRLHMANAEPNIRVGRVTPGPKDLEAAAMTVERRSRPRIPKVGGAPLNLFIRQPFTESNQEQQRLINDVLQVIDSANGFPYSFRYLTGNQAESATTFKKSFEQGTGMSFTPPNFRNHRLALLDQADVFINIRVGMSESSAFELAYHVFKGRHTPILFLVWKHAPIKTTLLRELQDVCDVTYLEFEHADDLRRGIHEFFDVKVLGGSRHDDIARETRAAERAGGMLI